MTKEKALSIVASLLAINTTNHIRSIENDVSLFSNATDVILRNKAVAQALGIYDMWIEKTNIHKGDIT